MSPPPPNAAPFRLFLSGVIQGSILDAGHHSQDYRHRLRDLIREVHPEAEVICPVELNPESAAYSDETARRTFFRELELAASADVTVAYVPVATMGTAAEMYRAFDAGAVVFTISPMAHNWLVRFISDRVFPDLDAFEAFVRGGGIAAALTARRDRATA